MKFILFFVLVIIGAMTACSSSDSGTSYKYQISGSGVTGLSHSTVTPFASNFVMKWNEAADGTITGVFTNTSTGASFPVTGMSDPSTGRTMEISLPNNASISRVVVVIATLGDLNGAVSADVTTYDLSNVATGPAATISVDATTTVTTGGSGSGNNSGGSSGGSSSSGSSSGGSSSGGSSSGGSTSGGTALADYVGFYSEGSSGSITENLNATATGSVGNGKYCAFTSNAFRVAFSSYLMMTMGVNQAGIASVNDLQGVTDDLTGQTASSLSFVFNGFPGTSITDDGYMMSGIKFTNGDMSKPLAATATGSFSGTSPRTLNLTYSIAIDSIEVCNYTMVLIKE